MGHDEPAADRLASLRSAAEAVDGLVEELRAAATGLAVADQDPASALTRYAAVAIESLARLQRDIHREVDRERLRRGPEQDGV